MNLTQLTSADLKQIVKLLEQKERCKAGSPRSTPTWPPTKVAEEPERPKATGPQAPSPSAAKPTKPKRVKRARSRRRSSNC